MNGLARNIPKGEKTWSAPEQRTQQTARFLGLSVALAEELRDCNYGKWKGRRMEEVQSEASQGFVEWLTVPHSAPHGGESVEGLVGRVGKWMAEQSEVKHTIAVTHPAVIRAAIVYALRLPLQNFWRFDIAPLTLTDLRSGGSVWTVRCSGCSLSIRGFAEEGEIGL